MKAIHPLELEALIEASKPFEIIDIRPHADFEKRHIAGSHSLPIQELTPDVLVRSRELPLTEPLYLISDSGVLARAAAANLEKQGLDNAVVVEGGMKACERDRLPVERRHTIADWIAENSRHLAAMGFAPEWH